MKNAHGVSIESTADRLLELNRQIFECAQRGSELIRAGESAARVNVEIDTLRNMFSRREIIVRELEKMGATERELYYREAGACTG